jgi:hypothetical protein
MQDAALAQFVEHGADHQITLRVVDRDRYQPTNQVPDVLALEGGQPEMLDQKGDVLTAGLIAPRVVAKDARVGTDLLGYECNELQWRLLVGSQDTSRVAYQAELYREPKSISNTAACIYQIQVLVAKQVMLGQLAELCRKSLENGTLRCGENRSTGHALSSDIFISKKTYTIR